MTQVWRSPFRRWLFIWIATALLFSLAITRVLEVLGKGAAVVWLAVFAVAPLALIVWAVRRALRKSGRWIALGAVAAAWAVLLAAEVPLYRVSIHLNF